MNDQFGGFDINSFRLDNFAPQQVQQQQIQQQQQQQQQHGYLPNNSNPNTINNNTNGPCMDSYDPNQVLMPAMRASPYNSMAAVGGQHSRSSSSSDNNQNGVVRNNHNRHRQSHTHTHTHQILVPASIPPSSRRTSSASQNNSHNHHQQQQQHSTQRQQQLHQNHLQTGFSDFEPIPIPKHGGCGGSSSGSGSSSGRGGVQQQLKSSSRNSNNTNTNSNNSPTVNHRDAVQQYQQQQQQQQPYHSSGHSSQTTEELASSVTSFYSISSSPPPQQNEQQSQRRPPKPKPKPKKEEWLQNLQVKVSGVSLEPMSGSQIVKLLKERSNEVLTRYLPCVDFLVQCQQELRKGLQEATTKRYVHHMFRDAMTPRQFHTQFISQLPERFYRQNRRIMTSDNLTTAFNELQTLVNNAKGAESQGCEVVKNTFLGGMKDGESWGLRKWLSKQGGALHICNDTECLSTSCQKLERELESTCKLAECLRPLAAAALRKLKSEIPTSYQEQSSAHPYLPFFHRLECALRGMANFDPEDDDVICIVDDDEVEELKAKASTAPPPSSKRKRSRANKSGSSDGSTKTKGASGSSSPSSKRKATEKFVSNANEDDDSDIEVLERKPAAKRSNNKKTVTNANANDSNDDYGLVGTEHTEDSDIMQELLKTLDDDNNEDPIDFDEFEEKNDNLHGSLLSPSHSLEHGEADQFDKSTEDGYIKCVSGGNGSSNISKFGRSILPMDWIR